MLTDMPSPTAIDLVDPVFNAIWNATKTWDVNAPEHYQGYCGLNGSHVMIILNAIRAIEAEVKGDKPQFKYDSGFLPTGVNAEKCEPVACEMQNGDKTWSPFPLARYEEMRKAYPDFPLRLLFTTPQPCPDCVEWLTNCNAMATINEDLKAKVSELDQSLGSIVMSLWATNYRDTSPNFELLGDASGKLSQLDNMCAGLRSQVASLTRECDAQQKEWSKAYGIGVTAKYKLTRANAVIEKCKILAQEVKGFCDGMFIVDDAKTLLAAIAEYQGEN